MTNYNERLCEILQEFAMVEQQIDYELEVGAIQEETFDTRDTLARDQAKQDITSLIKELVEEAINSECIALLNDLEEEQAACYSNHHKNSETFVPFVSLDIIQKAKEKYFEIAKRRIEEATK